VLKAVVSRNIDCVAGFEATTGCKSIGADTKQNFAAQSALQQFDFIATAMSASIARLRIATLFPLPTICRRAIGPLESCGSTDGQMPTLITVAFRRSA